MTKGLETNLINTPPDWPNIRHHPFACVVEFGAGIDLDGLTGRMLDFGYDSAEPIVLWRENSRAPWQVVSGRHRQYCAHKAGVTPAFRQLVGGEKEVREFCLKDIHRRHLTPGQRAMIVTGLMAKKEEDVGHPTGAPKSQAAAATVAGVSRELINQAAQVQEKGTPNLVKAAAAADISVDDAAAVAKLPAKEQEAAVADVLAGRSRTARSAARKRQAARKPLANGAAAPTYAQMRAHLGPFIRSLDVYFKFHKKKDGVEHRGLMRRLAEVTKQLRADYKKISKIEPEE